MDIDKCILDLHPYTLKFNKYHMALRNKILKLSDTQINDLMKSAFAMDECNCGWNTYAAAKEVISVCNWVKSTRNRRYLLMDCVTGEYIRIIKHPKIWKHILKLPFKRKCEIMRGEIREP